MTKVTTKPLDSGQPDATAESPRNVPNPPRAAGRTEVHRNPIKRFMEAVKPAEEARTKRAEGAAAREADRQLDNLVAAILREDSRAAARAVEKAITALEPLLTKKDPIDDAEKDTKSAELHDLVGRLLMRGQCALPRKRDDVLVAIVKGVEGMGYLQNSLPVSQLLYSTKAELLRREVKNIDIGPGAPQSGKVSIRSLNLNKLDALSKAAEDLLILPGQRKPTTTIDTNFVPGTRFSTQTLRNIVQSTADEKKSLTDAKTTIRKLGRLPPRQVRPISDVLALKEAFERLASAKKNGALGTKAVAAHVLLSQQLDDYNKRIETLLKGPIANFDASQWSATDLADLQQKLAALPSKLPSTVKVEQLIQADIDRRRREELRPTILVSKKVVLSKKKEKAQQQEATAQTSPSAQPGAHAHATLVQTRMASLRVQGSQGHSGSAKSDQDTGESGL